MHKDFDNRSDDSVGTPDRLSFEPSLADSRTPHSWAGHAGALPRSSDDLQLDIVRVGFRDLPLRQLSWGLSWKSAPGVWLFDEDASEYDNVAHQGERFEDFLSDVVSELHMKNLQRSCVWRSCLAGSPVIFIEQNIGVLRRLWCVVEFERVGNGSNVGVRVRRMVPRNLDVWDWTLIRPFLGFPSLMIQVFTVLAPSRNGASQEVVKELEKHSSATICIFLFGIPVFFGVLWWVVLVVMAMILGKPATEYKASNLMKFLLENAPTIDTLTNHSTLIFWYIVATLAVSFFVFMFIEAKKPWPNDEKKSKMLYHTVCDAIGRAKLSGASHFGW